MALVGGEAGIGKSRLLREVATTAASRQFLLIQGRCFPGDHNCPYALLEPAQRILRLAAVAGRRFDFALLRQISGLEEGNLLDLLEELIAAQLVVEESAEQFAFRHALTRQAIYEGILTRKRRALHFTTICYKLPVIRDRVT